MTFTDQELETLRNNTKQIEAFITSAICPNLRESVTVEFGNITTRRGAYGMPVREREFELYVGKNYVCGSAGGLSIRFREDIPYSDSKVCVYKDRYFGAQFIFALCRDWQGIKRRLLDAVGTQTASVASINNFAL